MNFSPNDRVVCVDDRPEGHWFYATMPQGPIRRGEVYFVEGIDSHPDCLGDFGLFILGKPYFYLGQLARSWRSTRFRKVAEVGHPQVHIAFKVEK